MANKDTKNTHITKEQFLELLEKNRGNLYKTYTMLGLPFCRYWKWRKSDPDFEAEITRIKNLTINWVEDRLFEKLEEGDNAMIRFYLSTAGNYHTTQNINANVDANVSATIDIDETIKELKQTLLSED